MKTKIVKSERNVHYTNSRNLDNFSSREWKIIITIVSAHLSQLLSWDNRYHAILKSKPECSVQKAFLKVCNICRKTPVLEFLFNKVVCLQMITWSVMPAHVECAKRAFIVVTLLTKKTLSMYFIELLDLWLVPM